MNETIISQENTRVRKEKPSHFIQDATSYEQQVEREINQERRTAL